MFELGKFFATKYLPALGDVGERTIWRSSKSFRVRKSGECLLAGINQTAQRVVMPADTLKYDVDVDYYFRPWKIFKPLLDAFKKQAQIDPEWLEKAQKHRDTVLRVLTPLKLQATILSSPVDCLW
jgi:hypothetical protein